MSTRGMYGYQNTDGSIDSVFLRWSNTSENSLNLSGYADSSTAAALTALGTRNNLGVQQIPERGFFTGKKRFWMPFIRQTPVENAWLFCYDEEDRDALTEFLQQYPDKQAKYNTSGKPELDISRFRDSVFHLYPQEKKFGRHVFENFEELQKKANNVYDNPEFAYLYSEDESRWICHSLEHYEEWAEEADEWNRSYAENADSKNFAKDIDRFASEVDNYSRDFTAGMQVAASTAEEMVPGILEVLGLLELLEEF